MKHTYLLLLLIAGSVYTAYSQQSFWFIENKGQWEEDFRYKADLPSGAVFFDQKGFTFHFADFHVVHELHEAGKPAPENLQISSHAYRMELIGANPHTTMISSKPARFYYNYFLGNDPNRWVNSLYPQKELLYREIYNGIDLRWYTDNGQMKYEYILEPGAKPQQIKTKITGAEKLELSFGKLRIHTSIGVQEDLPPIAFQVINGDTVIIPCNFVLREDILSFELGKYRSDLPLVIDPTLIFGSYSGSTIDNWGYCATYDGLGFLYSGGIAFGTGYPFTLGAYQTTFNGGQGTFPEDIVISKYDTTGGFMVYSTYLGGSANELPHSIIVNNYDELFVFGTTGSNNYPVLSNAFDNTFNGGNSLTTTSMNINFNQGSDIIISRLNVNGTALLASTYVGGTQNDGLNSFAPLRFNYADEVRGEIIIDNNNNIYVATTTRSTDFPVTTGCFQSAHGGGTLDGVVFKMDNSLTTMIWASYYGGSGNDAIYALDLYANDDIIVTGGTTSSDLSMTGPNFNTYNGGNADGFLAKIRADGSSILNSIYIGSPNYDQSYMVEKDKLDNVYVLGQTSMTGSYYIQNANFATPGGGQFIRKYTPSLDAIDWSTAWGVGDNTPDISPSAFLVDVCNKIYVSGWGGAVNSGFYSGSTTCGLPTTIGAFQTSTDCSDYYLMVIDDMANSLVYATFYGGAISAEHVDGGTSRFNRRGEIYQSVCAGCGSNDDFPTTPGAHSMTNNSTNCNNGVFKFSLDFPITIADFVLPQSECAPVSMTFQNTSTGANQYHWNFGDGNTSTAENPTHVYQFPGLYTITLIASDSSGVNCNVTDSIKKQILILSDSTRVLPDIDICEGGSSVIGIPPNGDPSLTYTWSPPTGLSDVNVPNPIANPTSTQHYQLLITNGNCTDTVLQTLNVIALPQVNDTTITMCNGDTVLIGLSNPGGANTFVWTPNLGLGSPSSAMTTAFPAVNTTYTLHYSNAGCADSVAYTLNLVNGQVYNFPAIMICTGDTAQISGIASMGHLHYQWTPPQWVTNPTVAEPQVFPPSTTTFVLYMDDGTCFDTLYQPVTVFDQPGVTTSDYTICIGESVQLVASGPPINGLEYSWQPPTYLDNPSSASPVSTPDQTIVYYVTSSVQGQPGLCNVTDTVTVTVNTNIPIPGFMISTGGTCDGIQISITSSATNADTTVWVVGGDTLVFTGPNPVVTVPFGDTVDITQIVYSGECREELTQQFIGGSFNDYFQIEMPNIFTPYGSVGINDKFCPVGFQDGDPVCFKMYIYNRWGILLWENDSSDPCWRGYLQNSTLNVVEGVYYWIVEYGESNKTKEQGFVHVIIPEY